MRLKRVYMLLVAGLALGECRGGPPMDVGQATPVTLHQPVATAKQVFDEIAGQSDTTFSTLPTDLFEKNPGATFAIDLDRQPFWLAMKEACTKSGVSLKHAVDTPTPRIILTREGADWTTYPAVTSGPFLVTLIGLQRSATVDMRHPDQIQKSLVAKYTVFCEPRYRLLQASLRANVEQATDDKGNNLTPAKAIENPLNFQTSWTCNLEAKLEYPATAGTKIPSLAASAKTVLQTKSETIEWADPLGLKDAAQIVAGRKITIKELHHGPQEFQVTVTFSRGEVSAQDWPTTLFPGNTLRLVDGEGKMLLANGYGLGGVSDDSTFLFKFEKDGPKGSRIGKPVKLVWEIPTQTRDVPLSFEFKNVPLP